MCIITQPQVWALFPDADIMSDMHSVSPMQHQSDDLIHKMTDCHSYGVKKLRDNKVSKHTLYGPGILANVTTRTIATNPSFKPE